MRRRRVPVVAFIACGLAAMACSQLFGIEEGHLVEDPGRGGADGAPDGTGGSTDGPGDADGGEDAGDACHGCAPPELVVGNSHGLAMLSHLELRGTTLYGTSGGGTAGLVWESAWRPLAG